MLAGEWFALPRQDPVAVKVVAIGVMILGAVSFGQLDRHVSDRDWRAFARSTQNRSLPIGLDPGQLDAVFQAVSALTTCGSASENTEAGARTR